MAPITSLPFQRQRLGRFRRGEAVDEIRGALRVAGGGEDRVLVILQDFKPVRDVGGVIIPRFEGKAEIGAQEGGAQLGDEFLDRVGLAAKALAAIIRSFPALLIDSRAYLP